MNKEKSFKYALMSMAFSNDFKTKKPTLFAMLAAWRQGFDRQTPATHENLAAFYKEKGMAYKPGEMTFEEFVLIAKEAGYDGVDMMAMFVDIPGKEMRRILEKHGMTLTTIMQISSFCSAKTDEEMQQKIAEAKNVIDTGADAGAQYVLIMPAFIMAVPGISREASYRKMVYGMRACMEYAKEKNVTLSTEPLHTTQVPYCSIGELKRIFEDVPDLTYTHDTGNMLPALEDPVEAIKVFKDRLVFVHMKDLEYSDNHGAYTDACCRELDLAVYGKGLVDFEVVMKALKDVGFKGFITLESRSTNPEDLKQGVKTDLQFFKDIESRL